jgi:hypothetical protein
MADTPATAAPGTEGPQAAVSEPAQPGDTADQAVVHVDVDDVSITRESRHLGLC